MSELIRERKHVTDVYYERVFDDHTGWGFSFPCDEEGNVFVEDLSELARRNYEDCLAGKIPSLVDRGPVKHINRYWEPGEVRCDCGATVYLESSWANGCDECGVEYDANGNRLAPREQWGEETGERFT
jgi:hypothetical protein